MTRIYKITAAAEWAEACAQGAYAGSAVDRADGFIHFSTADQCQETARRWFAGQDGLVLIAFDAELLGPELRWEPSRGGALFPHLYEPLPTALAVSVRRLSLDTSGIPELGPLDP